MTSFVRRWSPHFMSQMLQRNDQSGIHTYTMTHDTYHGYESLRYPMATGCWLMTPIAWCLNWPYSGEAAKRRTTSRAGSRGENRRSGAAAQRAEAGFIYGKRWHLCGKFAEKTHFVETQHSNHTFEYGSGEDFVGGNWISALDGSSW